MPNKCSVALCFTNYKNHPSGTVFEFTKDEELQPIWRAFLNRQADDIAQLKSIFVCERHFEEKYIQRNDKYPRLIKAMKPIPTVHPVSLQNRPSLQPVIPKLRKPPTIRIFQEDEFEKFKHQDTIKEFGEVNNSLLKELGPQFFFSRYEDHCIFYKMDKNEHSVPAVTICIRVDTDLHVRLYHRGIPLPLPEWFRRGPCKLTSKSMLQNFLRYIEQKSSSYKDISEELILLKYQKSPVYSANMIRYALLLRYSSLQTYKLLQEEFKLPSISLLRRITAGKISAVKTANLLRENGSISNDVILILDEMFLQKCEEYFAGDSVGADEHGELFKGVVCFMIVGLRSNIPYVVKALPETRITGEWLKDELLTCLTQLHESGFSVRGIVSDDHSSNVRAYRQLRSACGAGVDDLFIVLDGKKIYLFFDTVHLIKNIRNNLLNRKRFIFPAFHFTGFYDKVSVRGGEIAWRLFHDVYEKDKLMEANLRAAPKLSAMVLHPGNCKQNVPVALAIFHCSTATGIKYYFPDKAEDAANFLNLIDVWWTISNSKVQKNTANRLGNAAVPGDKKPEFLRAFADWIAKWDLLKLPNCDNFTLTAQTSHAMQCTLRCHAALIEDLLQDDYKFVLTARFQSDPLEKRYGQYRQMSGGRFLVGLRDVLMSEKILKIKSLVQEGFDIDDSVKVTDGNSAEKISSFLESAQSVISESDRIRLTNDSKDISDNVAGYIAKQLTKICNTCCEQLLTDSGVAPYVQLLSRGGLKEPSVALGNFVAHGFAMLNAASTLIQNADLSSRAAAELLLDSVLQNEGFVCHEHEAMANKRAIRIITNVFLNNQRKRRTETVVTDRLVAFKQSKRLKNIQ